MRIQKETSFSERGKLFLSPHHFEDGAGSPPNPSHVMSIATAPTLCPKGGKQMSFSQCNLATYSLIARAPTTELHMLDSNLLPAAPSTSAPPSAAQCPCSPTSARKLPPVAPKSVSEGRPKGLPTFVNPRRLGPILSGDFSASRICQSREDRSATTSGRFVKPQKWTDRAGSKGA
jgi:hypothetical protein